MEANPDSAGAGCVTLNLSNVGTVVHNFLVVKTDLAPDALPVNSDTIQVRESDLAVVARSEGLIPGGSEQVTAQLEPANYVLICNIPTHYQLGMHDAFTVR